MKVRHPDLVFHDQDYTYTYLPTGEKVNAEKLDEFAKGKLLDAVERLVKVALSHPTNGVDTA